MFKRRSYQKEIIDTGDYTEQEYEQALAELRLINRFFRRCKSA